MTNTNIATICVPKAALPVARCIRKIVKRPRTLPSSSPFGWLRWPGHQCPMGLIPGVKCPAPDNRYDFPKHIRLSELAIMEFAVWWDRQTDARAAVDAVWGPK